MKKVYLAGPITGLSYDEARMSWRSEIVDYLSGYIEACSPMRHKDYLKTETDLQAANYNVGPLSTNKGIVSRDRDDVMNCDLMIVNLLGAKRVSIGTMVEYGWADAYRKPVVTIMEADGSNLHHHGFILELSGFITDNIKEAAHIANSILVPGV